MGASEWPTPEIDGTWLEGLYSGAAVRKLPLHVFFTPVFHAMCF